MDRSLALDHLTALLNKDREFVWDLEGAVEICRLLEPIAPEFGCHVGLTGGCLYKDGRRKDVDILFYRIRQVAVIDEIGLLAKLREIGFEIIRRKGWVVKASYEGKPLDLFFPEEATITTTGKCIDDQYPAGSECPSCGKARIGLPDSNNPDIVIWVHAKDGKCDKHWPANAVGINFVLPVDPATGKKSCPDCQEELHYSIDSDTYEHRHEHGYIPAMPTIFKAVCKFCLLPFSYIDSYKGLPFCQGCQIRVNRQVNPNFVGDDVVNMASTVHNSERGQIDFSSVKSTIKDQLDDN